MVSAQWTNTTDVLVDNLFAQCNAPNVVPFLLWKSFSGACLLDMLMTVWSGQRNILDMLLLLVLVLVEKKTLSTGPCHFVDLGFPNMTLTSSYNLPTRVRVERKCEDRNRAGWMSVLLQFEQEAWHPGLAVQANAIPQGQMLTSDLRFHSGVTVEHFYPWIGFAFDHSPTLDIQVRQLSTSTFLCQCGYFQLLSFLRLLLTVNSSF